MTTATDYITVRIRRETRQHIDRLRIFHRETVDEVIVRAIAALEQREAAQDGRRAE